MRPGPVVHGALLAAALGFAWQTWKRDREVAPSLASLTVWPDSGAVDAVELHGTLRDVTVEHRGDYFWATVKKRTSRSAAPDAGTMSVPDDATTTEFPVGEDGEKALARLMPLKALRDLGAVAAKEEYGLGEPSDRLTVKAGGASHELVVGAKVFGGDDRYVLEPAGGHVYVIAGEVARPFDAPEFALRERKLHGFASADVAEVVLRAGGKERTLVRKGKGAGPGPATWADARTPDTPDQTLANFMDRVEQLAPLEYGAPPDGLTPVATLEYRGKDGKVLGTVELSKKQSSYYVKSERTRVLAKVSPTSAGRVEQDLAQIVQ